MGAAIPRGGLSGQGPPDPGVDRLQWSSTGLSLGVLSKRGTVPTRAPDFSTELPLQDAPNTTQHPVDRTRVVSPNVYVCSLEAFIDIERFQGAEFTLWPERRPQEPSQGEVCIPRQRPVHPRKTLPGPRENTATFRVL